MVNDDDIKFERSVLEALNAFALDIILLSTREELFWYLARDVVGSMGFEDCVVYVVDDTKQTITQVAAVGPKNPDGEEIQQRLKLSINSGITGAVVKSQKAIVVDDVKQDERYIADLDTASSEICVPFFLDGEVFGVIDCESAEIAKFNTKHLQNLSTVAAMTSAKLQLLAESDLARKRLEDLNHTNRLLRDEIEQREQTEAKLLRAQTMDALGQLTSGIAHDFNNHLAIISGGIELLEAKNNIDKSEFQPIFSSIQRSAQLITRLLAFSRSQSLNPKPIDLGKLVDGMTELLNRTLGGEIEIISTVDSQLWRALADAGQVENAILNLAINSRDSMSNGGQLTIECSNVHYDNTSYDSSLDLEFGQYVVITVGDSGCGISKENINRAIEPFFTTKEVGKGTGLGLSMVYGFAKQSGGDLVIYSKSGHGTTVKIFLPRTLLDQDS